MTPRRVHLEMVGAVVAGEGLERVAEIASAHAGAPVAVIVPRLGAPVEAWAPYERYVASRLAGGRPTRPADIAAEVPISSGGSELGAVLLLGQGRPDAGEFLHVAAVAALTEVAVAEARDETEQSLRGSFLEELLSRDDLEGGDILRRASRMGCDLSQGCVALCADPGERAPGRIIAGIASERPGALAQAVNGRVYALLPGGAEEAREVAGRLGRQTVVGVSSFYSDPADARRALEEAELVLGVRAAGGGATGDEIGDGTYRLLFRVLASHPEEVRSFFEDTIAPLVRYDEQYSTDLVGTLDNYLRNNCNMNATAQAIHAHRHTVGYRLERVKELSGLDPLTSEDRERLGLGLKAYRIIQPRLPR
jgi:PucR family transcriptional regulator, purine catabolism regulatory protein